MYISRSFTFPVFVFQLLESAKTYLIVSLAAEFFVAEAVGCRQDPHLKKKALTQKARLSQTTKQSVQFFGLSRP